MGRATAVAAGDTAAPIGGTKGSMMVADEKNLGEQSTNPLSKVTACVRLPKSCAGARDVLPISGILSGGVKDAILTDAIGEASVVIKRDTIPVLIRSSRK